MLSLLPLLPHRTSLMVALVAVAATIVVGVLAEVRGAARERAACLARAVAEQTRQALANETAREASRAAALGTLDAERRTAEILDEVTHAPMPDPPRCGLGADSVRRLDRLR